MDLDCHSCTPEMKIDRGCEAESPIPGKWNFNGERFSRCPNKIVSKLSREYMNAYGLIQSGMGMPYGDGWMKHCRKFLDAMMVIHSEIEKIRCRNAKRRPEHSPKTPR
jgi:hypothetical protein